MNNFDLNINAKLEGKYKLVIKHADGTATDTGWFDNLILNSGLDALGASNVDVRYGVVGSGTSTPIASQTQLDAQFGSYGTVQTAYGLASVSSGSPSYVRTLTRAYQWAQGGVVGTLSEIGIGPASNGLGLFSRALILDSLGSPTTLSLISTDQLIAYYAISITPNIGDTTGSVVISGTTYTYTLRLANAASFASFSNLLLGYQFSQIQPPTTYGSDATLGSITGQPTASSSSTLSSQSQGTYATGSYHADGTVTMSISQGNVTGGIKAMLLPYGAGSTMNYQVLFSSPIPKTALNTLSLTFRFAWSA